MAEKEKEVDVEMTLLERTKIETRIGERGWDKERRETDQTRGVLKYML